MDIFAPFKAGKDILVAGKNALLERFLQHGLGGAGTVSHLILDSSAKTLTFDLALKGEAESLPIAVAYLVEHNAHGTWVIIREVKTSKEWAVILAKRFLKNPMKVPDAIRLVL